MLLGYIGSKPPEGVYVLAARVLAAYYFIHFLVILPLLGRFEKTKPLPATIADAVLDKRKRPPPRSRADDEAVRPPPRREQAGM